jgi:hypothetical protein
VFLLLGGKVHTIPAHWFFIIMAARPQRTLNRLSEFMLTVAVLITQNVSSRINGRELHGSNGIGHCDASHCVTLFARPWEEYHSCLGISSIEDAGFRQ